MWRLSAAALVKVMCAGVNENVYQCEDTRRNCRPSGSAAPPKSCHHCTSQHIAVNRSTSRPLPRHATSFAFALIVSISCEPSHAGRIGVSARTCALTRVQPAYALFAAPIKHTDRQATLSCPPAARPAPASSWRTCLRLACLPPRLPLAHSPPDRLPAAAPACRLCARLLLARLPPCPFAAVPARRHTRLPPRRLCRSPTSHLLPVAPHLRACLPLCPPASCAVSATLPTCLPRDCICFVRTHHSA